ncbi:MAG: RDD family protein [Polyangiales bacterium]
MTDSSREPSARLINAMLERVDVNGLLDQVELNQLLDRVIIDRLLDRVDVDRLLDRVDVDRLLDRVDVDRLLEHVDVDALIARVDVNAIVQRVDIEAITSRARVGELVARGTTEVAGSTLDVLRRQAVGLDTLIIRFVDRVLGRDPFSQPKGPSELVPAEVENVPMTRERRAVISGFYAGPVSRLLAYAIDASVSFGSFGLIAGAIVGAINTVFGIDLEWDWQAGVLGLLVFSLWSFLYFWLGVAIAGKTLGMGIVGIKVVTNVGRPISPGRAAIRVLVQPISIATVVGLLGIVLDRDQRALHDLVAKTAVVHDWGDRPAELPAPLTAWLEDRGVDGKVPAPRE